MNVDRIAELEARVDQLQRELDAANADLQVLRDLLQGGEWFALLPETGLDTHADEASAYREAGDCLGEYREESGDGWPEEVENIQAGILIPLWRATQTDYMETPEGPFDYHCEYELLPGNGIDIERIRRAANLPEPTA